ncbi:MAG: ABC transporter permease subunit [Micromonosporaceae bacterium]
MTGLLGAEVLKLRVARTTWGTLASLLVLTAASLTINIVNLTDKLDMLRFASAKPSGPANLRDLYDSANGGLDGGLAADAANLYTSGQYAGLLIAMLVGVYLVAGEFSRHTITTTVLVEPRRHRVLGTKVVIALLSGLTLWALTMVASLPAGMLFLRSEGLSTYVGDRVVLRSMGLNGIAFLCWTMLGVGLGCLIRRLTAAVIAALMLYLTNVSAAQMLFAGDPTPGFNPSVLLPSVASTRLVETYRDGTYGSHWLGAAVLVGYGLVSWVVGLWLLSRRDIPGTRIG